MKRHRLPLTLLCLVAAAPAAFAAGSSTPTNYTPDPALRRAAPAELEARIRRACTVTQARQQNVGETALGRPCGCYARQTMRSLDAGEVQAYRETGLFNDTARAKAVAALQGCGLPAPR